VERSSFVTAPGPHINKHDVTYLAQTADQTTERCDDLTTSMSEAYMDKALPPEVLAVLPLETNQWLDVAHSIVCHAYAQKV
jgi:hypothetical protein